VVALDGKIAGRIQAGKEDFLPIATGEHMLAAATSDGDYWEQQVEAGDSSGPLISIPLQKVRSERVSLQSEITTLHKQVEEKRERLTAIRNEREGIVLAINIYADRYGKEMGLHDAREDRSGEMMASGNWTYLTSGTTMGQLAGTAEMLAGIREDMRAWKNQIAADAAKDRMHELEQALKDPLKKPRTPEQTSYLVVVREVINGHSSGRLITAPNQVDYRDEGQSTHLTCGDIRKVSGGNHLKIHLAGNGGGKSAKQVLDLQPKSKAERLLLLGDVYLACPKFTM
jgi:hypothetical protein